MYAQNLQNLSDRDLLILVTSEISAAREDIAAVKTHQEFQNGQLAEVQAEQHYTHGAVDVLRWVVGVTLVVMGIGVSVAGVILGIVVKGS